MDYDLANDSRGGEKISKPQLGFSNVAPKGLTPFWLFNFVFLSSKIASLQ